MKIWLLPPKMLRRINEKVQRMYVLDGKEDKERKMLIKEEGMGRGGEGGAAAAAGN